MTRCDVNEPLILIKTSSIVGGKGVIEEEKNPAPLNSRGERNPKVDCSISASPRFLVNSSHY